MRFKLVENMEMVENQLNEHRLSSRDIDHFRTKIAMDCRIPVGSIVAYENGFEIYNVPETDKDRMVRNLNSCDVVSNVHAHPSGYDYSHFDFKTGMAQPKQKYTISGKYNVLDEDIDYLKLAESIELCEGRRNNWTIDEMKAILEKNDDQVGRALVKLYELQTADEQSSKTTHDKNCAGFNAFDADILSSFAEFYMKYHKLSEKQLQIARKKIMKYAKQLVNIANGLPENNVETQTEMQ